MLFYILREEQIIKTDIVNLLKMFKDVYLKKDRRVYKLLVGHWCLQKFFCDLHVYAFIIHHLVSDYF